MAVRRAEFDRRVRRSRRQLRQALIELTLEKGYAAVTVEELAAHADVGRATFYTNFKDKDDLLSDIVDVLLDELRERVARYEPDVVIGFGGGPMLEAFRHAEQRRDDYLVILGGAGDGFGLRLFTDLLANWAEQVFTARCANLGVEPRLPLNIIGRTWAGELVVVLTWWLTSSKRSSPEEVTEMLRDLTLNGRAWAMGFERDALGWREGLFPDHLPQRR